MVNEHWPIFIIVPIGAVAMIFLVWLFGGFNCPRCGGKFVQSKIYPNASVCEKCNYLKVSD